MEHFEKCLFNIGEKLNNEDMASLKFLCLDCIPQKDQEPIKTALNLFDKLQEKGMLEEDNLSFLKELLFRIQRLDLLGRFLNIRREEIEKELQIPGKTQISAYRLMLFKISQDVTKEDLDSFKFFLRQKLPRSRLEDNMTFLDIVIEMEKKDLLGKRKLDTLKNTCNQINMNLVNIIEEYENLEETAVYRMDRRHRGHCVIFNNYKFTSLPDRPGTDKDAESLERVFRWLGFTVQVYNDMNKVDLECTLREYKDHPGHTDGDCFVCCILTHGEFGAVYSSDDILIPIKEIMSPFMAQHCAGLADKPKLFFIQACQGEEVQPSVSIKPDALNPYKVPSVSQKMTLDDSIPGCADFLLGLSTVPGYVAFRHEEKGSWYIQSLCKRLEKMVLRGEDILCILTKVNKDVSQQMDKYGTWRQMPMPAFTLRKSLVFPVPQKALSLECS